MTTSFHLWLPFFKADNSVCFDVQPAEFVQLNQGTPELIAHFLDVLGIEAKGMSWEIQPFCSPYYAVTRAEHWRDRYKMAWQVSVTCTGPGELVKPYFFGPHTATMIDPTWREQDDSWDWTERECVVIAHFPDDQWEHASEGLLEKPIFRNCKDITVARLTPRVTQARFSLGVVHFPEGSQRVDECVAACKTIASSVDWATSLRMAEQLQREEERQNYKEEIKRRYNYPKS